MSAALVYVADQKGLGTIAMEAIIIHGDVNIDNISIDQGGTVRNSMTHNFVDRGATTFWKLVVIQWGRIGTARNNLTMNNFVDIICENAWCDHAAGNVQNLSGQSAGYTHFFNVLVGEGGDIPREAGMTSLGKTILPVIWAGYGGGNTLSCRDFARAELACEMEARDLMETEASTGT